MDGRGTWMAILREDRRSGTPKCRPAFSMTCRSKGRLAVSRSHFPRDRRSGRIGSRARGRFPSVRWLRRSSGTADHADCQRSRTGGRCRDWQSRRRQSGRCGSGHEVRKTRIVSERNLTWSFRLGTDTANRPYRISISAPAQEIERMERPSCSLGIRSHPSEVIRPIVLLSRKQDISWRLLLTRRQENLSGSAGKLWPLCGQVPCSWSKSSCLPC